MANIIYVAPGQSINTAVNAPGTQPGDVIVVKPGVYHESVTVPAGKNDLRIVSEKPRKAVLDGTGQAPDGFTINAIGVMINGFVIRDFSGNGIQVNEHSARLIDNHIQDVGGRGINMISLSFENMIWKNSVQYTRLDGILASSNANLYYQNEVKNVGAAGIVNTSCCSIFHQNHIERTGGTGIQSLSCCNNVVENVVKDSGHYGIDLFNSGDDFIIGNRVIGSASNGINGADGFDTFIGNEIVNSFESGITIGRDLNILVDNIIRNNNISGIATFPSIFFSENNLMLDNIITENRGDGIEINSPSHRSFVGANRIASNGGSGVEVFSDFNNIESNKITDNDHSGIKITGANGTFVLRNHLSDNEPQNIRDNGANTVKFQNEKDEDS